MLVAFFQNPKWWLQIVSLLQPIAENPKALSSLSEMTKERRNSWHLRGWNQGQHMAWDWLRRGCSSCSLAKCIYVAKERGQPQQPVRASNLGIKSEWTYRYLILAFYSGASIPNGVSNISVVVQKGRLKQPWYRCRFWIGWWGSLCSNRLLKIGVMKRKRTFSLLNQVRNALIVMTMQGRGWIDELDLPMSRRKHGSQKVSCCDSWRKQRRSHPRFFTSFLQRIVDQRWHHTGGEPLVVSRNVTVTRLDQVQIKESSGIFQARFPKVFGRWAWRGKTVKMSDITFWSSIYTQNVIAWQHGIDTYSGAPVYFWLSKCKDSV